MTTQAMSCTGRRTYAPLTSFIHIILCAVVLLFERSILPVTCQSTKESDELIAQGPANYPRPNSEHNKVLGMILMFNFGHTDPMDYIVKEYLSMCEAGWDPSILILTTVEWSPQMHRYFRQRLYCYRTGDFVPVVVSKHSPDIGTALAAEHRKYLKDHYTEHDVFIYHEDDIIVTYAHLVAYLYETLKLYVESEKEKTWRQVNIGFQRYRRLRFGPHDLGDINEKTVLEQDLLEEMPSRFRPICYGKNTPYLMVEGNIHQAMWIFTRLQIEQLADKCEFLEHRSPSREFMSSFSLFDGGGNLCDLRKLLPAERLQTFAVYHYYQQRHVSWTPVFQADENIRAGYHYYSVPKVHEEIPSCWQHVVHKYHCEQEGIPLEGDGSEGKTCADVGEAKLSQETGIEESDEAGNRLESDDFEQL